MLFLGSELERAAVFVDAGYLFAQGSAALTGSKKARVDLTLDALAVINELKALLTQRAPGVSLLRIYWYDGAIGGSRPTAEQALLAHLDDVKLRLGFINSAGQQKGVDSLIVTDLIELARQKAICEAVLMSGDEDVRVGVQIAQIYGVRIHLLGVTPSRGTQSHQLLQESDTTNEWHADTIARFLSVRPPKLAAEPAAVGNEKAATSAQPGILVASTSLDPEGKLDAVVQAFVDTLADSDIDGLSAYWESERGIPSEFDKKLLGCSRSALDRILEREELRYVRAKFQTLVRGRIRARTPTASVLPSIKRLR